MAATIAVVAMVWGPVARPSPASPETDPSPPPEVSQVGSDEEQTTPAEQPPVFRTGINFVRVDVIVTGWDGSPMADLQPEDFEILEDGVPQSIETFRLVRVSELPPGETAPVPAIRSQFEEENAAAREDVRLIAMFLDDYHVRRSSGLRVREPLINFLQTLGPNDLVALMYPLTPVSDIRFSNNHANVMRAIEGFHGRKGDYTPLNEQEQRYVFYPTTTVERIRNEVSLSALRSLVSRLGSLREGRKAIILVSEGYSNLPPPELRDRVAGQGGFATSSGAGPFEDAIQMSTSVELMNELREVYAAANRNNAAIYALDPRGLAVFEYSVERPVSLAADNQIRQATLDTLRILAAETDGRAIVNQNDLEEGLAQVLTDSSFYYLIGYNSTQAPTDGEFHEIKVRVKRSGAEVRARKGYWALTAEETARALAPPSAGPPPAVGEALSTLVEPPRGRVVRVWVGTARSDNGRTRVRFVWEPRQGASDSGGAPSRVLLTAVPAEGRTYFRGRVPDGEAVSRDGNGRASATDDAEVTPSYVEFDADPGPMSLVLSVEGDSGRVIDREKREMEVPDFTGPQVAISTPTVYRVRNAFELRQVRSNPHAVPIAGRTFRRVDRLLVRFDVYGPGDLATATARLLNRDGSAMVEVPVQPQAQGRYEIDFPLSSLPPGEYLLEISGTAAEEVATELVAFRVRG